MAAAGAHLPLWDPDNVKEGDLIIRTDLLKVLNNSGPTLCKSLQLQKMWPYLIQLQVLDTSDVERIQHCGARPDQVLKLLGFIKKGQRWQYHALLRAMALTGQSHLLPKDGPDPEVYLDQEPQAGLSDYEPPAQASTAAEDVESPMPQELLETIFDHCKYYKQYLMRGHIFAFEGDPGDDYIDITQLYINTHPKMKDGHKTLVPISATKVLEKVGDSDPPLVVRLYGQPGDGKTSFTMNIAYSWSVAFMEQVTKKDGKLSLKSKSPLWTTMVFIKAINIKTTVEDTIREGLGCKEKDEETMMAHIKQGKGVAILVEAMDELHDKEAIEQLKKYVKKCKKNGGPTVLITSRTDLCCIDGQDFDRFLTLEGFTEEQAIRYVKLYTETCKVPEPLPASLATSVYDYATRHTEKMKAVLSNPLQLYLYCALAMRGELELSENSEFNIPKLFEPLERLLIRRGGVKVTQEQSHQFYKFCMYAILNKIREFPEALLNKFNVVQSYYVFLHKSDRRGPDGKLEAFYSFGHEVVLEYFGSRYIFGLNADERLSFLLDICSSEKWRNIQLIMIQLLLQDGDMHEDLINVMIRIILILQLQGQDFIDKIIGAFDRLGIFGSKRKTLYYVKQIQDQLKTATPPKDILHPEGDNICVKKVKVKVDFINDAFDKHPNILRDEDLFNRVRFSTFRHVLKCLEVCPPSLRDELVQRTILPLLPRMVSYSCFGACVVGGTRWAEGSFRKYTTYMEAWCPADGVEVLVHHAAKHKNQSTSSYHTLALYINHHPGLWGEPDAAHWSQEEWTKLLQHLPKERVRRSVWIQLHKTAPLSGLLSCLLQHADLLSQCWRVRVWYGRTEPAELQDLINLGQKCQQAGVKLVLCYTTIVTTEGVDQIQVEELIQSTDLFDDFLIA